MNLHDEIDCKKDKEVSPEDLVKQWDKETKVLTRPVEFSDEGVIGINLYSASGHKIYNPIKKFEYNLAADSELGDMVNFKTQVGLYGDRSNNSINEEKIRIGGVIVTGSIKDLKKLKGKPFIKASTLGIVTDKY